MGSDAQRGADASRVVDLSRYRSGRHSSRGIPVTSSSCTTLSAGIESALRHLLTAWGQTSMARANPRNPNSLIARSIGDFCSMVQVSTAGSALSTDGSRALRAVGGFDYRLHMVDINKCEDFADFLEKFMKAEGLKRSDIEEIFGVGRAMVAKYLTKGSKPDDDKIQELCRRYPRYDLKQLRNLRAGFKEEERTYTVRTEFGARIGRIAESVTDEGLKLAILALVSAVERDNREATKGTGTK